MKIFRIILLCFLILEPSVMTAQALPIAEELENGHAFGKGEELKYVIHYKWLGIRTDVGEATVSLTKDKDRNERPTLHSTVLGRTYKFWDHFFRVRDRFESLFYEDDITPIYFHRNIDEGGYKIINHHYWRDYDDSISVMVHKPDIKIDTVLPGTPYTFDIVTLFYHARNIDFEALDKGVNYPVSFTIDEEIFNIYFRYIGKEDVKVPKLGKFRAMKFAAKVVAGEVFKGDQEMIIWVSDDKNRVPLLFESPIIVGKVYGRLAGWDNLTYPFESRITNRK